MKSLETQLVAPNKKACNLNYWFYNHVAGGIDAKEMFFGIVSTPSWVQSYIMQAITAVDWWKLFWYGRSAYGWKGKTTLSLLLRNNMW
jgi:hypothetical protein